MERLLTCLFLFCSATCFAQNKVSNEEFLNSIYKSVVDSSDKEYYLVEESEQLYFYDSINSIKDFIQFAPKEILNEIVSNINSNHEKWNCNKLKFAKCLSKSDSEEFLNYSPLKTNTEKKINNIKEIYFFSKPAFSNDGNYVMIRVFIDCGYECASTCIYLFKKTEGRWVKLSKTDCAIS